MSSERSAGSHNRVLGRLDGAGMAMHAADCLSTSRSRRHMLQAVAGSVAGALGINALRHVDAFTISELNDDRLAASNFSLTDRVSVTNALNVFQPLVLLDDVRANYLATAITIPAADLDTLLQVSKTQSHQVEVVQGAAKWLRGFVAAQADALVQAYDATIVVFPLAPSDQRALDMDIKKSGGFTAKATEAVAQVIELTPHAKAAVEMVPAPGLQNPVTTHPGKAKGNVPKEYKCALIWCAILCACAGKHEAAAHGLVLQYLALHC